MAALGDRRRSAASNGLRMGENRMPHQPIFEALARRGLHGGL
ncbi:hypothetical protein GL4_2775 [Methyloceanibacter caenitepidi]|uniref:Uncharacterized protein n=1 Tax=Methyloceanibacter caenitepidi TaxID=1384459 RepID=A0A0A8K893_9HYPH|nr:hypothetical protein GL4_2775 [Methyloceanibacter caenitepidi]